MMKKLSAEIRISARVLHLWLFVFTVSLMAQESLQVNKDELTEGIVLTLIGNELISSAQNAPDNLHLVIDDSTKQNWTLVKMTIDNKIVWMQRSKKVVNEAGVVHWFDEEESGQLSINMSGIVSRISPESQIKIKIVATRPKSLPSKLMIRKNTQELNSQQINWQNIKLVNIERK
ncbi:MAG: hypothetical protein GWN01_06760 [Nitrosopumilaceae archaeon]|nr:hypothetical protein [Nitrosopumilaceae archaeon]NIX61236.1 hypothetical protein [Nitrosopumilaceae archaeon]